MPKTDGHDEGQILEIAYSLWLHEGCPEGRADDHWTLACGMVSGQASAMGEPEGKTSLPVGDPLLGTPVAVESPARR